MHTHVYACVCACTHMYILLQLKPSQSRAVSWLRFLSVPGHLSQRACPTVCVNSGRGGSSTRLLLGEMPGPLSWAGAQRALLSGGPPAADLAPRARLPRPFSSALVCLGACWASFEAVSQGGPPALSDLTCCGAHDLPPPSAVPVAGTHLTRFLLQSLAPPVDSLCSVRSAAVASHQRACVKALALGHEARAPTPPLHATRPARSSPRCFQKEKVLFL